MRALAALLLVAPALALAATPQSTLGHVDCGPHYRDTLICVGHPCKKDAQCIDPKNAEPEDERADGPYACLADAHVCGWLYPEPEPTPDEKGTKS